MENREEELPAEGRMDDRGKSPAKSSPGSSPLPPLATGTLVIPKKRRLHPTTTTSSPEGSVSNINSDRFLPLSESSPSNISPSKSRSVTSPDISTRRTPSLTDKPIPTLSPTVRYIDEGSIEINKSGSRRVTSPLLSRQRQSSTPENAELQALRQEDLRLDTEIRAATRLNENYERAIKYKSTDESAKLQLLMAEWRKTAQGAATYLYNHAKLKVEAMGGFAEFKRKQDEQRESAFSFQEQEFDIENLSQDEREIYEQLRDEYEERERDTEENAKPEEEDDEFTMKYMLKQFGINEKLVFPEGFEL